MYIGGAEIESFCDYKSNQFEYLIERMRAGYLDEEKDQIELYGILICKKEIDRNSTEIEEVLQEVIEYLKRENFDFSVTAQIIGAFYEYIRYENIEDSIYDEEEEECEDIEKSWEKYEEARIEENGYYVYEEEEDYEYEEDISEEEVEINKVAHSLRNFKPSYKEKGAYKKDNEKAGFNQYIRSLRDTGENGLLNFLILCDWMKCSYDEIDQWNLFKRIVIEEIWGFIESIKKEVQKDYPENNIKKINLENKKEIFESLKRMERYIERNQENEFRDEVYDQTIGRRASIRALERLRNRNKL